MTATGFRHVLGHFCTGVTVITGAEDGRPAGFACQAFAALSLVPPLVLFCPGRSSATWPLIARAGHFCVNVLAAGQQEIARRFGVSGADKFAGVSWSPAPSGAPVLRGYGTYDDLWVLDEGEWRLADRETVLYGHVPPRR